MIVTWKHVDGRDASMVVDGSITVSKSVTSDQLHVSESAEGFCVATRTHNAQIAVRPITHRAVTVEVEHQP